MISMREYATLHNISYEAVRKQVKRYETELQGHISKISRTNYLDDEAVAFLDEKRSKNPIIIVDEEKKGQIQRLSDENKQLLIKIVQLQDELNSEKDLVKELQAQIIVEKDHVAELQAQLNDALQAATCHTNENDNTIDETSPNDPSQSNHLEDNLEADKNDNEPVTAMPDPADAKIKDNTNEPHEQEKTTFWQKIKAFFS